MRSAAGSGAASVWLRGGRAAGAGPGSAAVAPALSARSHRRQRRPPVAPVVSRVSCAALTGNGLFGGRAARSLSVCPSACLLRSPLGLRGGAAPLVWLLGALGPLLAGKKERVEAWGGCPEESGEI